MLRTGIKHWRGLRRCGKKGQIGFGHSPTHAEGERVTREIRAKLKTTKKLALTNVNCSTQESAMDERNAPMPEIIRPGRWSSFIKTRPASAR